MFDRLFGWSKASKCKKVIDRARCRLRLLKNKRQAMVRQLRKDLVELIQSGHEETAINRVLYLFDSLYATLSCAHVEQLMEDENLIATYELLDEFCEFILTQLSYIRRHKECPNDINEAVSSLIFASARFGDLPELGVIRKLFGERYGERFTTTAVELFPGNLVSKQLKENLSIKSVPDDLKYKMVDEIARHSSLQPQVLAIQYYPEWQQVKENKGYQLVESNAQIIDTTAGSKVHTSEIGEIKRDATCVSSSISKSIDSSSLPEPSLADTCAVVSAAQKYPPHIDFPERRSSIKCNLQNKGERMALTSSARRVSFSSYPEEVVDYVGDIEKYQFSEPKDGACQNQMLLKSRSSDMSNKEKTQFGCDDRDMGQDKSESEKSSTRTSRNSKRPPLKRSKRRSSSLESLGLMDIGYMIYYHNQCKSPSTHKHDTQYRRKHHKLSLEGIPTSSYAQKRLMLHSLSEKEKFLQSYQSEYDTRRKNVNFKMSGCSLEQPSCYFCLYDYRNSWEAQSMKPKREVKAKHAPQAFPLNECCHCQPFWDDELNQGIELVTNTITQKPRRKSYSGAAEYHIFNYPEISSSVNASNSRTSGSFTRIETEAPYSRAMTMPQERHRDNKDKMLRTYSCPTHHPNHVHPKLPDYDDIAAKFTALKKERAWKTKTAVRTKTNRVEEEAYM
ncbi:hypothetical protein VNO77_28526 [Canavalia gladiata]|uniref:Uncharacterized protein n=1 Tax=Canavalia gladiata TaxID=3824 RepID=A0AAN9KYE7_CANGL